MQHKKLKLEEALSFFREGKPIRCILWPKDTYIYIGKNGEICTNSNNPIIEINLLADYELYTAPILDETEKKYLENYLAPFKGRINYIYKEQRFDFNPLLREWLFSPFERIRVVLDTVVEDASDFVYNNAVRVETINLPFFEKGTMYRKMKLGQHYTLEDLGL